MKTKEEITENLRKQKIVLLKKYPIKELALFGSYSRDEQTALSDIDIMVEFYKPVGLEFIDLADELEALLKIKVDLVSKNGIKSKYYKAIEQDLIYV